MQIENPISILCSFSLNKIRILTLTYKPSAASAPGSPAHAIQAPMSMLFSLADRVLASYKPSAASAPGTPERARATDGGRRGRTAAGGSPPPPEPKPQAHKIASARGPTRKSVRRTSGLKQRIHPSRSSPRRRHSSPEPRGPCSGRCRSCRWCRAGRAPTRTAAGPRRSLRPAARRRPPRSSASDVSAGSPGRWMSACLGSCACARVRSWGARGRRHRRGLGRRWQTQGVARRIECLLLCSRA